jgi:hypothetical protein
MKKVTKVAQEKKTIDIPAPKTIGIDVLLEGTTPLIMHRFGKKAQADIAAKQAKKAAKSKEARDPQAEYLDCIYRDEDGDAAMPVINFKAAMLRTWELVGLKNKNAIRFGIKIPGEYAKVIGKHAMRQDYVRIPGGSSLAYRAEFKKWQVKLSIQINLNVLSIEQALNIITEAGQACGVGDWRPEKSSGNYGTWKIAQALEVDHAN